MTTICPDPVSQDDAAIQPPAQRRRGRPPRTEAPTRDRIIAAALSIFSTHGFDGASIRQITSQAGVDVAMVSHVFGSKLDLWKAVIDDIADKVMPLIEAITAADDEHQSVDDRLGQTIGRLIDVVCDTPYLAQFVVTEAVQQTERAMYIYERLSRPIQESMQRMVQLAHAQGRIGDASPEFFVFTFLGSIAITAAGRPFIQRHQPLVADEVAFKRELKRAVLAQIRR